MLPHQGPLAPKGLDGVEVRGPSGWVDAGADTDHAGTTHGHNDSINPDDRGPPGDRGDAICTDYPQPEPNAAADQRQGDGLHEKLDEDVASTCADCQADADLPRAL